MPTQRRTAKSAKKSSAKKASAKSASKSASKSRASPRASSAGAKTRGRSGATASRRASASRGRRTAAKGSSRARQAKTPNAIDLLTEDHRKVQKMFRRAERLEADDPQLQEIVKTACAALTEHAELEEELFYPALEEQAPDLIDEAQVEHEVAKQLIAQLEGMQAGDERYKATFKVLGEYVNHHIEEEESQVFRAAKRAKLDLAAIGEQIVARKTGAAEEGGRGSGRGSSGARSGRGETRSSGSGAKSGSSRGTRGGQAGESSAAGMDEASDNDDASTGGDSADDSERPGRGGRGRLEASSDEERGGLDLDASDWRSSAR